jgi:hypothetical protein
MTSTNERVANGSWWILCGAALLLPACGAPAPEGPATGRGGGNVETFEAKSELPKCNNEHRHQVYYVSSEDQFYVCENGANQPLDLSGGSGGASLILIEDEPPGENCTAGGHVVHVGLDQDDDGILDPGEITGTDYVCNPGTILAGELFLDEQAEVDALAGVSWIVGNLAVVGDLDLSPLAGSTRISGSLLIQDNPSLTDLGVLENLIDVEGSLRLANNDALTNIEALAFVDEINNLELTGNDALTNIDGLSGVSAVSGEFILAGNASLANLDGLSELTSIIGQLRVMDNDALTNIDGLGGVTSLSGFLQLSDNGALVDVDGLAGLTSVGNLHIQNNDALTNLDGLAGVTSIDQLSLEGNASLTDIGLDSLLTIASFFIVDTAVTDLDELGGLGSVTSLLFIVGNPNLTRVSGLTSLELVGQLVIHNHPNLPPCDIDILVAGIDTLGSTSFFNNTGSGTCMP